MPRPEQAARAGLFPASARLLSLKGVDLPHFPAITDDSGIALEFSIVERILRPGGLENHDVLATA